MIVATVDNICFELLDQPTLAATAGVIARAFAGFEPMAVACGLSEQDMFDLILHCGPQALQDRLTVVARDTASNQIVGAMLMDDLACPGPPLPPRLEQKFQPVWALLGDLSARYQQGQSLAAGHTLHFAMLAVETGYGGKKIAHHLIKSAQQVALARGYRVGVTEATSTTSQHIFRQAGFIERLATDYQQFTFQGQPIFSGVTGSSQTILMEKPLI